MPEILDQQRLNEKLAQYMQENFFNVAETHEQRSIRNRISIWREALRKKISTFSQLPSELFWQAWQRFDGYRRERPHHGYSDVELLQFFYYGVREYYQAELDVAGFWDFSTENVQGAYRIVDNMAFSSRDNPMAEMEAQIYCLMEEANKREDVEFNMIEQEQINRSSSQELIYCDLEHPYYDQEQAPPPQYQNPTPQTSKSQTTIDEIKALFYNGNLEIAKATKELKEEIAATKIALANKFNASDTHIGIAENQVSQEVDVTVKQQGTLPMCTIAEEETEMKPNELAVEVDESAEEINLQPFLKRVDTLEEHLGAAESKEATPDFVEEPSPVDAVQTTPVVQEEVTTLDEDTLLNQEV